MLCLIKINTLDQPTLLDWRYLQLPACISLAPTQSLHLVPIQLQRRLVPAVLVQKAMQTQIGLRACAPILACLSRFQSRCCNASKAELSKAQPE